MTGQHPPQSAESLSTRVLVTVAEHEGVPPTGLSSPLYDAIDPDALDLLFTASAGHLRFPYCGHLITVYADGRVEIEDDEV